MSFINTSNAILTMNSSIAPIFALNLMSCTESVMPEISGNKTNESEFSHYKGNFVSPKEEWYFDNRRKSIEFPVSKKEYAAMSKRNKSTPVKRINRGKKNPSFRKYHNIKQPGRTNCSQRLF